MLEQAVGRELEAVAPVRLVRRERSKLLTHLGRVSEMRWIRAGDLQRDSDYNRTIRSFRVEAIRRNFNPDGLGLLYVSEREDGLHYIIDGQHRHQSILDLGMANCLVPCAVYRNLTRDEERLIFLLLNRERLPLSAMEAFQARAAAGENLAGSMKDLLARFGIRLVKGRQPGAREIASVSVLEEIDRRWGERMMERVLSLFEAGWPEQPRIYRRQLLMAAASVLADPAVDDARFALAMNGCSPAELERRVVEGGAALGYNGWSRYADAMRELYDSLKG
ncbi:MAG: DUF6551 family protein [Chloroflexota bacterium]